MKAQIISLLTVFAVTAPFVSAQDKAVEKTARRTAVNTVGAKPPAGAPDAAADPNLDEPAQIAAAFFTLLQKSRVEEAYANLTKGSKIAERPEELRSLKAKTSEAIQTFGAVQGSELVQSRSVGAHLIRRTYLSLGKDFPLRWRFYFYRADNIWRLVDLRVDDRLSGMFEEPEAAATDSDANSSTGTGTRVP